MLNLSDVTIKYGKVTIIELLSYEFKNGNIYLLYGENGTGKTTLLKLISGLINCSGSVNTDDKIYYLPINPQYPAYMKAHNYLEYINKYYSCSKIHEYIKRYELENKYISFLSKGNKVKLGIIQGLLYNADIYLFDEILDGLDENSKKEFKADLKHLLNENKLIIMATHENNLYKEFKPIKLILRDKNIYEKAK